MEIKEAVGILKGLQEPEAWEPQITEKTFEALDMAITALINADGKPLIYKQIIKESDLVKMGVIEPGEIKAGQVEPQPEAQWIPCEERMPEEHEWLGTKKFGTLMSDEVYVTLENLNGERFTRHLHFYNGAISPYEKVYMENWFKGSKPIAWMPLPKPFEGEPNEMQ